MARKGLESKLENESTIGSDASITDSSLNCPKHVRLKLPADKVQTRTFWLYELGKVNTCTTYNRSADADTWRYTCIENNTLTSSENRGTHVSLGQEGPAPFLDAATCPTKRSKKKAKTKSGPVRSGPIRSVRFVPSDSTEMENYPSRPEFERTESGVRVAGTGLPSLRGATRAGTAARAAHGWRSWGRGWWWQRGMERRDSASGGDPYVREQGPGNIPPLTRLRMDLGGYGAGKTKDECGTGADARAIADSNQSWTGFKLRVLTQNLWALPVISKCLEARVHAFAKTLQGEWDVIALQEVWHARERDALRRAGLLAGLRYSRHFEQGCGAPIMGPGSGGTGLLLLSRFPISESLFRRFSANGQPYQLSHCDYLGGKGVGLARLLTPAGAVDVYVSHLHADYSRSGEPGQADRYKAHRVAQAFEVAYFIRLTSKSPLVLLMTDLNAGPVSLTYGMQRSVAGLRDAFLEAKPGHAGHTCEAVDNVFSNRRDPPARIDYVLFKSLPPHMCMPQPVEPLWELKDCWLHKAYIPAQDAVGLLPTLNRTSRHPHQASATTPAATNSASSTTTFSATTSTTVTTTTAIRPSSNTARGRSVGDHQPLLSERLAGEGGRMGGGRGSGSVGPDMRRERQISISDHYGVAAEFIAHDPESEESGNDGDHNDQDNSADNAVGSPPGNATRQSTATSTAASDASYGGGTFPQGLLLAKALTEIGLGVEASRRRREHHLYSAKALAIAWVALVAAGVASSSNHPIGYLARGASLLVGGLLCAAAVAMLLVYWFSSKEELQGLKEVYQAAKNYDRHLPMDEAFSGGFDTSQINSYMEDHFG